MRSMPLNYVIIDQGDLGWLFGMLPCSHEVVAFLVGAVMSKVLLPGFMLHTEFSTCKSGFAECHVRGRRISVSPGDDTFQTLKKG